MAEKTSAGQMIVALAVVGAGAWYFWGGGMEKHTANTIAEIHQTVSDDAIQQYEIVKRQGSAIDRCVQAQMVEASYLAAKDEANYVKWKQVTRTDCKAAGLPVD